MTKQQTIEQLSQSPEAIVNFVIDNNPAGVQSQMDSVGLLPPELSEPTKAQMKEIVMGLTRNNTAENREMFNYVLAADYVDENTNYTGGMRQSLEGGIPSNYPGLSQEKAAGTGLIILDGIFSLADTVFGWLAGREAADVAEANAAAAEAYLEATTIAGIPQNVFIAIIATLGVIIIIALLRGTRR